MRGQPGGSTYFVSLDGDDANPGTAGRPWRHIEWAMTRPFLRGGDTIRIRAGIYRPITEPDPHRDSTTDDALIRPVASGDPGRPITVTPEPGASVVLTGRFRAASWEPVGTSNVYFHDYATPLIFPFDHPFQVSEDGRLLYRVSTLEGIDGPGRCFVDTATRRIYVWTSDGLPPSTHLMEYGGAITGIEFRQGVRHWRLAGFSLTGFRTAGVLVDNGAGSIELDRMDISYIGAHRPGADLTSGHAVATYDTSGGNSVHDSALHHTLAEVIHISQTGQGGDVYESNDIHSAGGAEWFHEGYTGRRLAGPGAILRGDRTVFRGNRIYRNGYHGLVLESDLRGPEGPAAPSENLLEGNVFAYNAGNGIYGDGKNGLTASRGNVIRFNLFDRNNQARPGSGDAELRVAGNLDEVLAYNNTFYAEKANAVWVYAGRVALGTAQGADAVPDRLRMFNNIVVQAGSIGSVYPLRAFDVGREFTLDYNNWFRAGLPGPVVNWNGEGFPALEAFRDKTGQERRGLSTDPRFVSIESGHFWLRAISPMIGRGSTVWPGIQGLASPDLGAFPYRPLLAAFPAELRFVSPPDRREPPSQTVQVRSAAEKALGWTARTSSESWLRLAPEGGETPGAISVSAQATGLEAGVYSSSILVAPALEGEPPIAVRVSLTVLPAPPRRRR